MPMSAVYRQSNGRFISNPSSNPIYFHSIQVQQRIPTPHIIFSAFSYISYRDTSIAAFYYARIMKTMIIDAGNEEKPAFRLPIADTAWVWLLLLGNVVPLFVWRYVEGFTRASLTKKSTC